MNTHRSTPAFAIAGKGDCPPAPVTQTTAPDQAKSGESLSLWAEVNALGGEANTPYLRGYCDGIEEALTVLESRGFTEHADAASPQSANDSGKSAAVASNAASVGDCDPALVKTAVGPDFDGGAAMLPAIHDCAQVSGDRTPEQLDRDPSRWRRPISEGWTPTGRAWLSNGAPMPTVTRDTLDPTAAEQRANLERIAGTPRPSAVDIKRGLDILSGDVWQNTGDTERADLEFVSKMLDRLGVEVLNLDRLVEDQRRQLDRIAANAKPLDGLEVTRLVARARRVAEGLQTFDNGSMNKADGRLIDELVAALNDQARQVMGLRETIEAFGYAEKPRCRVVTSPRFYGYDDRERAVEAFDQARLAGHSMDGTVDAIANALGMRRAEA